MVAAGTDRPEIHLPRTTLLRRRAALRRAGVAPLNTPEALAQLALDLGPGAVNDLSMTRLLWVLGGNSPHTRVVALARYAPCVAAAMDLLPSTDLPTDLAADIDPIAEPDEAAAA